MIKLFFLIAFFLICSYSLRADEQPVGDQEFMKSLSSIKDPFEEGFPKPIVIAPKPIIVEHREPKNSKKVVAHKPNAPAVVVEPPMIHLQGVIVGEDINEAIIDDKIVPLGGETEGAKVISVTKKGVVVLYKGQKFIFKVE